MCIFRNKDSYLMSQMKSLTVSLLVISGLVEITGVDPESGGTVQRLLAQQESLIQPGLSFINSSGLSSVTRSSVAEIHNNTASRSSVSATINIVNWSRWLLGYPVYYFRYGHFKHGESFVSYVTERSCDVLVRDLGGSKANTLKSYLVKPGPMDAQKAHHLRTQIKENVSQRAKTNTDC